MMNVVVVVEEREESLLDDADGWDVVFSDRRTVVVVVAVAAVGVTMEEDDYYPSHCHFHRPCRYHCHSDRDASILSCSRSRRNRCFPPLIDRSICVPGGFRCSFGSRVVRCIRCI